MTIFHHTSNYQIRSAVAVNQFYTSNAQELVQLIDGYLSEHHFIPRNDIAAVIVPHAGYMFSGKVAASAFAQINPERRYQHIFLIGSSHQVWLDKASIATGYSAYETPLGQVLVDEKLANQIKESDSVFTFSEQAHAREHCLEVQLPFLQRHLKHIPAIVPIIISTQDINKLERIATVLKPYFTSDNLFVISSDFSHYPNYSDAKLIDSATANAILSQDVNTFLQILDQNSLQHIANLQTSACGESAITVLMMLTQDHKEYQYRHIMYQNSGDSNYTDHDRVVGYHAFTISRMQSIKDHSNLEAGYLCKADKQVLKTIAKKSILARLKGKAYNPHTDTEALKTKCGAFITIHTKKGKLRGCIGHLADDMPLYQCVAQMASAAAFDDPRFYPLRAYEYDEITIEISVLTPMKRIYNINEFQLHRDGIFMRKGNRSGTFLPQVADDVKWTKEEFFGHCAQDKVGIGWDGWKDAELYTYQAIAF